MKLVQDTAQAKSIAEATVLGSDANGKKKENGCSTDLNRNSVIAKRYVTIKASDFSCLSPQSITSTPTKPTNHCLENIRQQNVTISTASLQPSLQMTVGNTIDSSLVPCTPLENVQRPWSNHQSLKSLNVQTKNQREQNVRRKHEDAINNIANCKKTKALASRFIEPARHDSTQLPEDLTVGKSAFSANSLRMEVTDIGGTRVRQQGSHPHNPQPHNNIAFNVSQPQVGTSPVGQFPRVVESEMYGGDKWSHFERLILGPADVGKTIFTSAVCSEIDTLDWESSEIKGEVESPVEELLMATTSSTAVPFLQQMLRFAACQEIIQECIEGQHNDLTFFLAIQWVEKVATATQTLLRCLQRHYKVAVRDRHKHNAWLKCHLSKVQQLYVDVVIEKKKIERALERREIMRLSQLFDMQVFSSTCKEQPSFVGWTQRLYSGIPELDGFLDSIAAQRRNPIATVTIPTRCVNFSPVVQRSFNENTSNCSALVKSPCSTTSVANDDMDTIDTIELWGTTYPVSVITAIRRHVNELEEYFALREDRLMGADGANRRSTVGKVMQMNFIKPLPTTEGLIAAKYKERMEEVNEIRNSLIRDGMTLKRRQEQSSVTQANRHCGKTLQQKADSADSADGEGSCARQVDGGEGELYKQSVANYLRCAKQMHVHTKDAWSRYSSVTKRIRLYANQQKSKFRHFERLKEDRPFITLNLIGKGGFAEVWESLNIETGELTAVKITSMDCAEGVDISQQEFIIDLTCREVSLQRQLKHPNIVEMQQCFEITPSQFVAVLDLCEGPDLDRYISLYGPVREPLARLWINQLLNGLTYIHETANVVHFDMKPHNVLIHKGVVKIADFGLHQPMSSVGIAELDMCQEHNQVGTLWYMPPEHLMAALSHQKSRIDYRYDVWSVGVILYQMLFQRRPFGQQANAGGATYEHAASAICHEFLSKEIDFPKPVTPLCKSFLLYLLSPLEERPTARDALHHPFVMI